MKRSSYGERDYAFGQMILTLRTTIGLTQAGLADQLGVSQRAVAQWEAGSSYPKAEHLKQLITLGVRASAFLAGREAEEIRALWQAAHQKLLFDESWLAALLGRPRPALTHLPPVPLEEPRPGEVSAAEPTPGRRVDWGEALAVPSFYDRQREVASLTQWVVQERCRVVSVLGLGSRGASLQGVEIQDTSLAGATLRDSTFTETFDATWSGGISGNGTYWAVGSGRGEVRVWREGGQRLHLAWQAHTDTVKSLAFSPDERTLATSSWDGAIKLWDLEGGTLLWTIWQTNNIYCIAFAPNGQMLASGGDDATIRLWDA